MIAPAGPVNPDRLRLGLDRLAPHLRLRVPDDIARADGPGYLAGSDERRAAELDGMLRDPDIRAVIAARGGYGVLRILPLLDPAVLRADPKPIVGFSDVTALLSWSERAGVRGIHGPVVSQLGDLPEGDLAHLIRLLRDPTPLGLLPWRLAPIGAPLTAPRTGRLVGGNLALIANLVGTPWQVDSAGAVVLLEEVGEQPYALDRYLTHTGLGGALDGAVGALVGDLVRCGDADAAMAVVDERLRHVGIPGLGAAPIGHGTRNVAVPWGARVVLHPDGGVEILDGAVS